jgi:hypothetical protein
LESVAPYLVPLDYDDKKTRKFLSQAWGNNWGVFIRCDTSQDRLRRHLRSFISVRDPGGRRLLFRFYDPRVLRTYLPTCTSSELEFFYGPIECFWTESKTAENLLEFRFDRGILVQRTLSLAADASRNLAPRIDAAPRPPSMLPFGSFTIRQAQMDVFSQTEIQKFEDWMVKHLTQFFPQQCQALGKSLLRELIQHGIQRAAAHRITAERDVCKFIDLMIVFGRDFDRDNKSAWAGQILANRKTPRSKIRSLYEAAKMRLGR